MRASARGPWKLAQVIALGVLMILPLAPVFAATQRSSGGATATGGTNLGNGLYTVTPVQQVQATPYWDNFNCPSQAQFGWCVDASGVAYIPPANLVVLSEVNCRPSPGCNGTHDSLVDLNPSALSYGPPVMLNCTPWTAYYPGTGSEFFVPCSNSSQGWSSVLAVNYQTASVVANISNPGDAISMAYDSSNGMLYGGAAGASNGLAVINPISEGLAGVLHVPGATFAPSYWFQSSPYTLVYDSDTNRLIVPSTTSSFLVYDPVNGTVTRSVSLAAPVESLAIDSDSNQLFVSTDNATTFVSGLSVFNAQTYALEARLVLPNCIDDECAQSNSVNQILPDPLHGDAYLVSTVGLFTLNLSTLSLVGTTEDYGDGPADSATYVPGPDQVISTYAIFMVGPGMLLQLQHGSSLVLTSVLWLPPTIGELTIVLLVLAAASVVVWFQVRRWLLHRRSPVLPPTRSLNPNQH
jgi:hypothetical protein